MSKEFETIEQPLMVEIIRRRQMPHLRPLSEAAPHFDVLNCVYLLFVSKLFILMAQNCFL
jgi:hypothetical protein